MRSADDSVSSITSYIINFLVRGEDLAKYVSYGNNAENSTKIVIVPDEEFWENYGSRQSMPKLPFEIWENIPILYGKNKEKMKDGILYIYADIVASSFYMLSRYEEMVNTDNRDVHGRYTGVGSLIGQANLLDRPLVDEYGLMLLNKLRSLGIKTPDINKKLRRVFLTHDVDHLWNVDFGNNLCIGMKKAIKSSFRKKRVVLAPFLNGLGIERWNEYNSFGFIKKMDDLVLKKYKERCKVIFFLVSSEKRTEYTDSYMYNKKFDRYKKLFLDMNCEIGIHESYEAGDDLDLLEKEINELNSKMCLPIYLGRHHFLRSIKFEEMMRLENLGINVDFTMGYADVAGFRLGTSREVRWIDPTHKKMHNLYLQPLIIMEGILFEEQYMGLNYEKALERSISIIDKIRDVNGDFTFLIHNNNINSEVCPWLKKFYKEIVKYLVSIE